jgi:hypothetical protein
MPPVMRGDYAAEESECKYAGWSVRVVAMLHDVRRRRLLSALAQKGFKEQCSQRSIVVMEKEGKVVM